MIQPPTTGQGKSPTIFSIHFFLIALVFLMMLWIILKAPLRINHDCSLYLQTGGLLLDGKLPYVDFYDTNPPLIMYVNMIPAGLARISGLNPVPVFLLFVFLLSLFSTISAGRMLRNARPAINPFAIQWSWAFYSFLLLLHNGFGQREHLFALLYFPFFILRWTRYQGNDDGKFYPILLGSLAAVGACLKPHFLLILIAPELIWLIQSRSVKKLIFPETISLAVVGLLYPLHFLLMPAGMTDAFFKRWLPFLKTGYEIFNNPAAYLFKWPFFVVAAACILAFALSFLKKLPSLFLKSIGAALAANLLIFLLQHKGWPYHLYPAFGLALVGFGVAVGAVISVLNKKIVFVFSAIVLISMSVVPAAVGIYGNRFTQFREPGLVKLIAQLTKPDDKMIGIATSLDLDYPVMVQMQRAPGSRYLHFFSIPMLYMGVEMENGATTFPYRAGDLATEDEKLFLAELEEDIVKNKPRLILIVSRFYGMTTCPKCPGGFNLIEYFTQNGFIANAMKDYKVVVQGDLWGFVRTETGQAQP